MTMNTERTEERIHRELMENIRDSNERYEAGFLELKTRILERIGGNDAEELLAEYVREEARHEFIHGA